MTCTFPGCGRRHLSKGLCGAHYAQQARSRALKPLLLVTRQARRGTGDRRRVAQRAVGPEVSRESQAMGPDTGAMLSPAA